MNYKLMIFSLFLIATGSPSLMMAGDPTLVELIKLVTEANKVLKRAENAANS